MPGLRSTHRTASPLPGFDTDVLSAVIRRDPPLALIRRLAQTPPEQQFTTAVSLGELLYGAARRGSATLTNKVRELVIGALLVLPFDERAAEVYGPPGAT